MATCSCDSASSDGPPDVRAANALCPHRPPPKVAVCIVGGARTFAREQAWRSLKRHLIESYGGRGLSGSTPDVFFHLKLVDDDPKSQKEWRFDPLHQAAADVCGAACAFHPEAVALLANGSHEGPSHPAAIARGCFRSGFFSHREHTMRAVSQWSGFAACHASLAAREARASDRYDVVLLTRPDTVWYAGVPPHCALPLWSAEGRPVTITHRGPSHWNSTLEWLLLMPRAHAESVLTTAVVFDTCRPAQRCCELSRSEDLLEYALARAGSHRQHPFGVDILRHERHAQMRNAGCMQFGAMGFDSAAQCRATMYGGDVPASNGATDGAAARAPTRVARMGRGTWREPPRPVHQRQRARSCGSFLTDKVARSPHRRRPSGATA